MFPIWGKASFDPETTDPMSQPILRGADGVATGTAPVVGDHDALDAHGRSLAQRHHGGPVLAHTQSTGNGLSYDHHDYHYHYHYC